MAAMDTKEVFDLYYKTIPETTAYKVRGQVDRPEVYAYEEKLGKQIFDMDAEELIGLVLSFNRKRKLDGEGDNGEFGISIASYDTFQTQYRAIWNYYIDNIEVIRNPWNSKEMRGLAIAKTIANSKERFTYERLESLIQQIHATYEDTYSDYGKYLECLLLLYYNGFANSKEVVTLKEDMINFETHDVTIEGRTIHLSDRCLELLKFVHSLHEVRTRRANNIAVPYQDGYFKIVLKADTAKRLQDCSTTEAANILNQKMAFRIRREYNIDIKSRTLYLLGFYDYIVKMAGKERAHELITAVYDKEGADELVSYAEEYGFNTKEPAYIKKILRPFI